MAGEPFREEAVDDQVVLDALQDSDCREIVEGIAEPMTAKEVAELTDIPLSTTYRKLDRLTEATIVEEQTEIRPDGHHASVYCIDFETVVISREDGSLTVEISRPTSPEERLAGIWSEVRNET